MRLTACLALFAVLAATPACAADDDSAITVTRPGGASALPAETYESNMVVPELYGTIRVEGALRDVDGLGEDLITQSQRQVSDTLDAARSRRQAAPDIFSRWSLSVDWSARYVDADLASAVGVTALTEGRGDPTESFETIVRDLSSGADLPITAFLANRADGGPALRALSEAAFAAWAEASPLVGDNIDLVDERTLVDARDGLAPRASTFAAYALRASQSAPGRIAGFELYFPAGALGHPSEGAYQLFVPAAAVAGQLDPARAHLFAE